MFDFSEDFKDLQGPNGSLSIEDETVVKLMMLMEGETSLGAVKAAKKYGFSRARYYQLLDNYKKDGFDGLRNQKTGPKKPSKCTEEVVREVLKHRYLDPDASAAVICQKITQTGYKISVRSVQRILRKYGLEKKTPPDSAY